MIRKHFTLLFILSGLAALCVTSTLGVHGVGTALNVSAAATQPIKIGSQIAGSFADATGHSGQSHLVYAANAGVWWLFTLTSAADSSGGSNHIVKAYRSSGSDLATASWTAATDSPGAAANGGGAYAPSGSMGGGRALGVVYVNNAPTDVIHAEVALAWDGQDGVQGHIRARLTATGITWESWNYHVEGAATWATPRATSLGLSTGKYIHSGGPTLQQEVDANARKSTNPDTGASWTSGFSTVAVIDNSMINQNNAMTFAPLANNVMLAVYDNGGGVSTCYNCGQTGAPEPNLTNLGYKKSNANGSWPLVPVGSQGGGDGQVFSSWATIDQNDWALVALNTTTIRAYRRNAAGTGIDAAAYNAAANTWSSAPAPPPFGPGQAFKARAGLFGANDGFSSWLFVINTDAANTILYSRNDGTTWSSWAAVPGTDVGTHARRFISGAPVLAAGQIGLIWTEGTTTYDVFTTSLTTAADVTPPSVSLLEPADASTVFGDVPVRASASDDRGVSGVQFKLDNTNLGPVQTTPPYQYTWDSRTVANGTHSLEALASDGAGNTSSAFASVTVSNGPVISAVSASSITASSAVISWTTDVDATGRVDFGVTTGYGQNRTDPALATAHQFTLTPLSSATTYHYQVTSSDAAGNTTLGGDFTFTTAAPADTTPPTVSFTAPANGATVSGTMVPVSASASDNVGVFGVQFKLDGNDLGAEDRTSP
jgi:Bacterial Ig domain